MLSGLLAQYTNPVVIKSQMVIVTLMKKQASNPTHVVI